MKHKQTGKDEGTKKSRLRVLLYLFVLLLTVIFVTPYMLTVVPVQTRIAEAVSSSIQGRFSVETMEWSWFPTPGLAVKNLRVTNPMIDTVVKEGVVRVSLLSLVSKQKTVKLDLHNPEITIKTLKSDPKKIPVEAKETKGPNAPSQSTLDVKIINGTLRLPSDGFLAPLSEHGPPMGVFGLDATISLKPDLITIASSCRLSFAKNITAAITIRKHSEPDNGGTRRFWNLDIQGHGLDLTEATEKVMLLFGFNNIARLVCNIVRGGRAKTGGYRFRGYTSDFKHLSAMEITAEADNAIIDVPGVNLHLVNACGPIRIENGVLTGEKLSADLGNSHGKNGALSLALRGENKAFNLGLDLDADISELPGLLKDAILKNQKRVTKELEKITAAKGRATARLVIGESLKEMAVTVTVTDSDSIVSYLRLRHPVAVRQGTWVFTPGSCTWKEIKAGIGPHIIENAEGHVSWQHEPRLELTTAEGTLDAGEFLAELLEHPAIGEKVAPYVRSLSGDIHIQKLSASGPLKEISAIDYQIDLAADTLTIRSPVIPGTTTVNNASVHVTPKKFNIAEATVRVNDKDGVIKGLAFFSRILTFINVTELLSFSAWKNIFSNGYHYISLTINGTIQDNRLSITEALVIGDGLDFYSSGDVDLTSRTLDLRTYVQPLKMVNTFAHIILFNSSDEHTVSLIPLKITGQFNDPDVSINKEKLKDVESYQLLGMVRKTLNRPAKLIKSLIYDDVEPETESK